MILSLNNIGKRYNYEWIFRNLSTTLESGNRYAILGPNGAGKSTLLKIISGSLSPSEGKAVFLKDESEINIDHLYQYVSIAAPYLELIEEYTLKELFHFHHQFKPFIKGSSFKEMAAEVQLRDAYNKQIRYYSSGMKQRAKLAQAFFSDTPILLLDEPCTNLDKEGVQLYQKLLSEQVKNRLIIISSNSLEEYIDCDEHIHITDYK